MAMVDARTPMSRRSVVPSPPPGADAEADNGHPTAGFTFEDRGFRALKGLDGDWRLAALADPEKTHPGPG